MTTTQHPYISECLNDPWKNTKHQGYVYLTPKHKGRYGEMFVSELMEDMSCSVKDAPTSTAGYDRIIDNWRTEIKFSLATRKNNQIQTNKFIINHVSVGKDWERLIFCGINPDGIIIFYITKEDFITEVNRTDSVFNYQQGGKGVSNDDYMCTKVSTLINREYVHPITEW